MTQQKDAGKPEREPVKISDPKRIRALAHPARLAVIEELYAGRELTATECAEIAGLSPSAMSYRGGGLELAGIVERADSTGDGRERPWRSAGSFLQVESDDGAGGAAAALSVTVLARVRDQYSPWLARRSSEPKAWRDASAVASGQVWLLPDEVEEISDAVDDLINKFRDRSPEDHPEGSRRVRFAIFAFPSEKAPTEPQ